MQQTSAMPFHVWSDYIHTRTMQTVTHSPDTHKHAYKLKNTACSNKICIYKIGLWNVRWLDHTAMSDKA